MYRRSFRSRIVVLLASVALVLSLPESGFSQTNPANAVISAFPVLNLPVSVTGRGMGGASAVFPSVDPTTTINNPAQLGLFAFNNTLSAATLTPRNEYSFGPTPLLPQPTNSLSFDVTAIDAGVNLASFLRLPLPVGVGVGYSRATFDYGGPWSVPAGFPAIYATPHAVERSENLSVGLAVEYLVRLGIGWNFKHITSGPRAFLKEGGQYENSADWFTTAVTSKASDFGILLAVPVGDLVRKASGSRLEIPGGIRPQLDLSSCYVKANVGEEVKYLDQSELDALPRTAILGLGLEAALVTSVGTSDWKLLSASIVRQAEDQLWHRRADGSIDYSGGAGRINFLANVVGGRFTEWILVRKGWQIEVGEFLTLRGGSVGHGAHPVRLLYQAGTSGYSFSLGGLVKLLEFSSPTVAETPWIAFVGDHLDLQYHHSDYSEDGPVQAGPFQAMSLVIKGIPWQ